MAAKTCKHENVSWDKDLDHLVVGDDGITWLGVCDDCGENVAQDYIVEEEVYEWDVETGRPKAWKDAPALTGRVRQDVRPRNRD